MIRFLPETRVLSSKTLEFFCIQIENAFPHAIAFLAYDAIYAIANLSVNNLEEEYYQRLAYFLRDSVCKAGVSNKFSDIQKCTVYKREADLALELGNQKNPTFWYYQFQHYTFDYILKKSTEDIPKEELISPVLRTLKLYDKTHPGFGTVQYDVSIFFIRL